MLGSYRIVPVNKKCRAEPCGNETEIRMHSAFHVFRSDQERTFAALNRLATGLMPRWDLNSGIFRSQLLRYLQYRAGIAGPQRLPLKTLTILASFCQNLAI